MGSDIVPIIPLDSSPLSKHLLSHLKKIQDDTGRYICFRDAWDIKEVDPSYTIITKARSISEHNQPYLIIDVDMKEISKSDYDPIKHDPIIAHEAGHLVLLVDGYRQIGNYNQPEEAHWAVSAVFNWLSDPLINKQILEKGFDFTPDRLIEIKQSTTSLNRGAWKNKPIELSIRLGLSFLLEPNIPPAIMRPFELALRKGLKPICVNSIFALYKAITAEENFSPEIYKYKVKICFQILNDQLNLALNKPKFSPKYLSYSKKEIEDWVNKNIVEIKDWP